MGQVKQFLGLKSGQTLAGSNVGAPKALHLSENFNDEEFAMELHRQLGCKEMTRHYPLEVSGCSIKEKLRIYIK
jgi:predicted ABC-type transport system involved in lysophospholipase L1 biosynthesis ATPase subunit